MEWSKQNQAEAFDQYATSFDATIRFDFGTRANALTI